MTPKTILLATLLHSVLVGGAWAAQSATADSNASCNAAFHRDCVAVSTTLTTTSVAAAPAPLVGSGWGGALILLAGMSLWLARRRS